MLVDSNHQQEFVMKQKRKKDVGIVTFYLIGLLPTNHIIYIIYYGIPEFYKKTFDVYSLPLPTRAKYTQQPAAISQQLKFIYSRQLE